MREGSGKEKGERGREEKEKETQRIEKKKQEKSCLPLKKSSRKETNYCHLVD